MENFLIGGLFAIIPGVMIIIAGIGQIVEPGGSGKSV